LVQDPDVLQAVGPSVQATDQVTREDRFGIGRISNESGGTKEGRIVERIDRAEVPAERPASDQDPGEPPKQRVAQFRYHEMTFAGLPRCRLAIAISSASPKSAFCPVTSAASPKFAPVRGTLVCELRNQSSTSNYKFLVPRTRSSHHNCRESDCE